MVLWNKKNNIFQNTMTYVIPKIDIKVVPFTIDRWDEREEHYISRSFCRNQFGKIACILVFSQIVES